MFIPVYQRILQFEAFYEQNCASYPGGALGRAMIFGAEFFYIVLAISIFVTFKHPSEAHTVLGAGAGEVFHGLPFPVDISLA